MDINLPPISWNPDWRIDQRRPGSRSSAPAFSPLDIASCRLLLDPSNIGTLWQNTTATTPVTATGQALAAVRDLTTNAELFIQSDAARRPSYELSGGRPSMFWEGSTVRWLDATIDFSAYNAVTVMTALRIAATGVTRLIYDHNGIAAGHFAQRLGAAPSINSFSGGDGTVRNSTQNISTGEQSQVITTYHRITAPLCRSDVGNAEGTASTLSQGGGNYGNGVSRIGARYDNILTFSGNIFALAVFTEILAGDNLANAKAWMATKAGVTL